MGGWPPQTVLELLKPWRGRADCGSLPPSPRWTHHGAGTYCTCTKTPFHAHRHSHTGQVSGTVCRYVRIQVPTAQCHIPHSHMKHEPRGRTTTRKAPGNLHLIHDPRKSPSSTCICSFCSCPCLSLSFVLLSSSPPAFVPVPKTAVLPPRPPLLSLARFFLFLFPGFPLVSLPGHLSSNCLPVLRWRRRQITLVLLLEKRK